MTKFIIRCARSPEGQETLDLEFKVRPGSYSRKWVECIKSVQGLAPYQNGFPKFYEKDPLVYQTRIHLAICSDSRLKTFLGDKLHVDQNLVNQVHRYIEHNQLHAADHLELHNDIHYLESIWKGAADVVFKKMQWVPPGLLINMEPADYQDYTTEPCTNFIQEDFSHVGRSPHNSFLYGDDSSLDTSCVVQHQVSSGVKWFIPDDSHIYNDADTFRTWVAHHQEFFNQKWDISTPTDPRLCVGRVILADGVEDYSTMDRSFDYITQAFISE